MGLGFVCSEGGSDGAGPDGGPTEILAESPFRAEDGSDESGNPRKEFVLSLVSLNDKTASTVDFCQKELEALAESGISCGRGETSTVVLADPRVSVRHFTVLLGARGRRRRPSTASTASGASEEEERHAREDGAAGAAGSSSACSAETLQLLDESSNGTWLNDTLVGKDRCLPLVPGDRIFVLPAARVGQAEAVGFAVLAAGHEEPRLRPGLGRQLAADLRCRLCTEKPIHRCVTVVPCGHIFDLGCLVAWRHRSSRCPECGLVVLQAVRNRGVDAMAEAFLQKHPEAARSASTLKLLEVAEKSPSSQPLLSRLTLAVPTPARSASKPGEERPQASSSEAAAANLPRHLRHLGRFAAEATAPPRPAAAAEEPAEAPAPPSPQAPAEAPRTEAPVLAPAPSRVARSRMCAVM